MLLCCGSLLSLAVTCTACHIGSSFVRASTVDGVGTGKDGPPQVTAASRLHSGSSVLQESSYELGYGERGASLAFVASEPITGVCVCVVHVHVRFCVSVCMPVCAHVTMRQCGSMYAYRHVKGRAAGKGRPLVCVCVGLWCVCGGGGG